MLESPPFLLLLLVDKFLLSAITLLSLLHCFFFNTDFNLITLLLELIAAESFCKVGVIGTDGKGDAGEVCEEDVDAFELVGNGGGSNRQNVSE